MFTQPGSVTCVKIQGVLFPFCVGFLLSPESCTASTLLHLRGVKMLRRLEIGLRSNDLPRFDTKSKRRMRHSSPVTASIRVGGEALKNINNIQKRVVPKTHQRKDQGYSRGGWVGGGRQQEQQQAQKYHKLNCLIELCNW